MFNLLVLFGSVILILPPVLMQENYEQMKALLCKCPNCCSIKFDSVCGSDGVTYLNDCELTCAKNKSYPDLKLFSRGACEKKPGAGNPKPETECECPHEDNNPVCDLKGKWYESPCFLACAQKVKPGLERQGGCDMTMKSGSTVELKPGVNLTPPHLRRKNKMNTSST